MQLTWRHRYLIDGIYYTQECSLAFIAVFMAVFLKSPGLVRLGTRGRHVAAIVTTVTCSSASPHSCIRVGYIGRQNHSVNRFIKAKDPKATYIADSQIQYISIKSKIPSISYNRKRKTFSFHKFVTCVHLWCHGHDCSK